jgi:hypothetical protein
MDLTRISELMKRLTASAGAYGTEDNWLDLGLMRRAGQVAARRHGGFTTPLPRWVRIFVASVMLTTAVAALVTHDLLLRWDAQSCLQIDATRMAIAGAVFLPGAPERATLAAAHSAELSRLGRSEVVHAGPAPNRMSFSVRLERRVPVLLLRLLGSTGTSVTAQATATVQPYAPSRQTGGSLVFSALRRRRSCPSYISASV